MYARVREAYKADYTALLGKATTPVLILDEPYETEPKGTPLQMRTKTRRAMCEGAAGFGFNAGPDWYHFVDWTTATQGTNEAAFASNFWSAFAWQSMAPDVGNVYVTGGRGEFNSDGYVTVLASATALVAHLPNGALTITVATSRFSKAMRARWWDPTNNHFTQISSSLPNTGSVAFTNLSRNAAGQTDWLLVLDQPGCVGSACSSPALAPACSAPWLWLLALALAGLPRRLPSSAASR